MFSVLVRLYEAGMRERDESKVTNRLIEMTLIWRKRYLHFQRQTFDGILLENQSK